MQHRRNCVSLCIIENKSTWHSANCETMDEVYRYSILLATQADREMFYRALETNTNIAFRQEVNKDYQNYAINMVRLIYGRST